MNTTSAGGLLGASRTGPGIAGGAAKTFGVQQTDISKRAAPPESSSFSTFLGVAATLTGLISLAGHYWFWIPTAGLAFLTWKVFSEEVDEHEVAMKHWRSLRVCQRCGNFYSEPAPSDQK